MIIPAWQAVLDFWFLPASNPGYGSTRPEWFRKDTAFDHDIRNRFGDRIEAALVAEEPDLTSSPPATLARILLLDQFTRNAFRDTPRAPAAPASSAPVSAPSPVSMPTARCRITMRRPRRTPPSPATACC